VNHGWHPYSARYQIILVINCVDAVATKIAGSYGVLITLRYIIHPESRTLHMIESIQYTHVLNTHLRQHTSPPSFAKTSPFLGRLRFYFGFIIAYRCVSAHLWGVYLVCTSLDTTQHWHQPVVPLLGPLAFCSVVLRQLRQFTTCSTCEDTT